MTAMAVPDSKSPLSIQVLDAVFSFFLVEMENNLCIRRRGEPVSLTKQLLPEFQIVEYLAVERDPQRTILVAHGLLAACKIDDAQPGMRQTYAVIRVKSGIV